MTAEYRIETETRTLTKLEALTPIDDRLDSMVYDEFDGPKYDLIDFDLLLDNPTSKVGKTDNEIARNVDEDGGGRGLTRKRKHGHQDQDVSFLDLLDDIFVHDKSMDMVNCPLERIEELLHYRLAGSPDKKRRKIAEDEDDSSFATPKTYACHYCPKKFYSSVLCHHHQVRHTKVLLRCPWCGHSSRSNSGLKRHIQYFHHYTSMCQVFFDSR